MMNEYESMSKEKAFITKTFLLLEQYRNLASELPDEQKLDATLQLNCMLGLLVIPQQKINNGWFIRIHDEDEWGINLAQIDVFPEFTSGYHPDNSANAVAGHLRNSISHNNFQIISEDNVNVTHISFSDFTMYKPRKLTFKCVLSINRLAQFVTKYCQSIIPFLD